MVKKKIQPRRYTFIVTVIDGCIPVPQEPRDVGNSLREADLGDIGLTIESVVQEGSFEVVKIKPRKKPAGKIGGALRRKVK